MPGLQNTLAPLAWVGLVCAILSSSPPAIAGGIETAALQQSWPRQRVRQLEVGHYPVRWRERASRQDGIFAGVRFEAPLPRQQVWDLANDYTDVGQKTPGVKAVRFLERQPTRQVIQLDVQVLWKTLTLTFEVEQDPPQAIRFQLVHDAIGEYRGLCVFEEVSRPRPGQTPAVGTAVELITQFKPARPVPMRLLLVVERMTLLRGVKSFLDSCEQPSV